MSSLLQSTGSSPYVLVHIVGPLAATISLSLQFNADSTFVKILNYTIRIYEISYKMLSTVFAFEFALETDRRDGTVQDFSGPDRP